MQTITAAAGELEFALEYRRFAREEGWTVHVYGPRRGRREEILRFDCFDENPHFHLGWSYLDRMFIPIPDTKDPLGWVLEELRTHLSEMLRESEVPELMTSLSSQMIFQAIESLRVQMEARPAA